MYNQYRIKTPFYALAPMANISIYPFASQCARFGADLVWTPMVHTDTIINNWPEAKKILDLAPLTYYVVQIVGSGPEKFVKSVKIIEKNLEPKGVDLNFGCPDKNIVKSGCGGALLKTTDQIVEIIKAVRKSTKLPISVKTRAGWDDMSQIYKLAPILEKAGINMLTVHPRTVKQGFQGKADWEILRILKTKYLKHNSRMLLCGSGDITTWQEAIERQKETGCDGVMIGRGALGRPWLFSEIKNKGNYTPTLEEIKKLVLEISQISYAIWGSKGIVESRKHFAHYFRGFHGAQEYRKKLMTAISLDEIKKILI